MNPTTAYVSNRSLRVRFSLFLVFGALLAALSCSEESLTNPEPSFRPGVAAREVTVDFSSFDGGNIFDPEFYRRDGILFSPEKCGTAGCEPWFIDLFQGDAAINVGHAPWEDVPLTARFTRPISDLTLSLAPGLQGTATYVLSAYTASGKLLATTSRTVTQDFGDPANTGFGYFTMSLTDLPKPAKSFSIVNVFVRSSFELNTFIPFGVSTISYTHWGKQP